MKLTIGIPVYNCEDSIGKNLDIILKQIQNRNDVEIVISDNASTDNSSNIIKGYLEKNKNIRYFKNTANLGMDRNVIHVIKKAQGDFIHILSADDFYEEDGIERLIEVINRYKDLSVIVLSHCYLNVFNGQKVYMSDKWDDSYCEDIKTYIEKEELKTLCLSNIVLRLSEVNKIDDLEKCVGLLWPHLYFIKEILEEKSRTFIFSFRHPLVVVQYGNQGWVHRDAIYVYYRAIKLYEEITIKNNADFENVARMFLKSVISPRTQKCKSVWKNIKISGLFYKIYKKYYGGGWSIAWFKFSIKLIAFRKKDFFEHCR